jgi:hypothetical protein
MSLSSIPDHLKQHPKAGVIRLWIDIDPTLDTPGHPNRCPIAHRIEEAGYHIAHVCKDYIAFTDRDAGLRYYYNTPEDAIQFQETFDETHIPQPFMLVLRHTALLFSVPIMRYLNPSNDHPHYESVGPTGTRTR